MPYFLPKKGFRDGTDMLTRRRNVVKCFGMKTEYAITVNFRFDRDEYYQAIYQRITDLLEENNFISMESTSKWMLFSQKTSGENIRNLILEEIEDISELEDYDFDGTIIMTELHRYRTQENKIKSVYLVWTLYSDNSGFYDWEGDTFENYYLARHNTTTHHQ